MVEKITNAERFAEYLIDFFVTNPKGFVQFATYYDGSLDTNSNEFKTLSVDTNYFSDWYFAKVIDFNDVGYPSRFIVIDSCSGEEAVAIPLNGYSNRFDEDDRNIIRERLCKWYSNADVTDVFVKKTLNLVDAIGVFTDDCANVLSKRGWVEFYNNPISTVTAYFDKNTVIVNETVQTAKDMVWAMMMGRVAVTYVKEFDHSVAFFPFGSKDGIEPEILASAMGNYETDGECHFVLTNKIRDSIKKILGI